MVRRYKGYIMPKVGPDKNFGVHHYAGDVVYAVESFVEKNKDALSKNPRLTQCPHSPQRLFMRSHCGARARCVCYR